MKNHLSKAFALICAMGAIGLQSCEDTDFRGNNPPFLLIEEQVLNFDQPESEYLLVVKCNEEYQVKTGEGLEQWMTYSKTDEGDLNLAIAENQEKGVRHGELYIVTPSQADTVTVNQLGWGKAILVSQNVVNMDEVGGTFDLDVTANIPYAIDLSGYDYISQTVVPKTRAYDEVTVTHHFVVKPNKGDARNAIVEVACTDEEAGIEPTAFVINQKGMDGYNPDNAPELAEDFLKTPDGVTGDGGERAPSRAFSMMIDGDLSTSWLYDWTKGPAKIPQYIEFTWNEKVDFDYLVIHPEKVSFFNDIEIYVTSDVNLTRSTSETLVYTGKIPQVPTATRINFPQTLAGVSKVKFVLTSRLSDGFECKEVQFFQKNPDCFDYSTLFANPACTELKAGITEDEILNCNYSFYKSLAWYMYNDKYSRDFRIADYKAYPHPDLQRDENKIWASYSLLDNPTGIFVKEGDNLIVMADLKEGPSVKIRVQNLDSPGKDGFNEYTEYTVAEGINNLKMSRPGLIYVLYHPDNYETAPDITLHFASGNVNGYFDSQNPKHLGRWKEMIAASKYKYFDVLGKYAHLTFPTGRFQSNTKDGEELIKLYDELVYGEQLLLGLKKYDRMFKNRLYFNVMYIDDAGIYAWATQYHTAYREPNLGELMDETRLKGACWGPAHEVGHINQTKGFHWNGLGEVSNNVMSMYVQTAVYNQSSRLNNGEKDEYFKTWNKAITKKTPHANLGVFEKLVPFWQLELYFGKTLGKTPMQQADNGGFYPDVYEYLRTHEKAATDGAQQLEFVYNCSQAAKANLLDFFEKQGFLTPVDEKNLKVTQSDIDNLKSRVNNLGYSKPDVALEYITDSNIELFKNKPAITKGTAARSGNKITLYNWKNVVAFEVVDAAGNKVYIAKGTKDGENMVEINMDIDWKNDYRMKAVAANDTRIDVDVK